MTSYVGRSNVASPTSLLRVTKRLSTAGAACLSWLTPRSSAATFAILTYHRIAPRRPGEPAPTWNVTPAHFTDQIQGLLAKGYRPLALRDALQCHRHGTAVPPRSFVVTFDDGYENVYRYALPVLRRYRVPATVFLATAYLDQPAPFPFDDWALDIAARFGTPPDAWRPLTRIQCREMVESQLVELGCHTHTHSDFLGRRDAFQQDLQLSLRVLADDFGVPFPTFSFPFGRFDEPLVDLVRRSGAVCALTTQAQLVRPCEDPYLWGRFSVDDSDTAASLAGKIDGWYTLLRDVYRWCKRRGARIARRAATNTNSHGLAIAEAQTPGSTAIQRAASLAPAVPGRIPEGTP